MHQKEELRKVLDLDPDLLGTETIEKDHTITTQEDRQVDRIRIVIIMDLEGIMIAVANPRAIALQEDMGAEVVEVVGVIEERVVVVGGKKV